MKVLHVLDHSVPLQSGYSFRTLSILRCQQALGIQTFQLTSSKHHAARHPEESYEGFLFYRTPRGNQLIERLPVLNQLQVVSLLTKRLHSLASNLKPDLLHVHSPVLNGLAALRVRSTLGIPIVYEMRASWEDAAVDHGTTSETSARYKISRALETWVLKRADAVFTISSGLKQDILSRGIPETSITLAPNAIDLEYFASIQDADSTLPDKLSLEGKTVIGFIGSFYSYEGLDLLIRAFARICSRNDKLVLLLVGGGVQEVNLKRQVQELSLSDRVIFTGRVPHSEVSRYYGLIDLFVYPRYSMRLTELVTPLKPLEAMANRGVVIASDVGGHRELVRNKETGLLFKAGSLEDLEEKIEYALNNKPICEKLADAGRVFIESERSWQKTAESYLPVYHRLIR